LNNKLGRFIIQKQVYYGQMQQLASYINGILDADIHPEPVAKSSLAHLPLYIKEAYKLYHANIYQQPLLLAEVKKGNEISNLQIEKHLGLIGDSMHKKVVLVTESMTALNRQRLIQRGINFIVPGKQLFLPDIFIDLREIFNEPQKKEKGTLLPSAQYILLYHILHRHDKIQLTQLSFKELAEKLGYTQMAITKAVENLKVHELCTVVGGKEKYIHFDRERNELWNVAKPHMVSPVLKKVYVDKKPDALMPHSNISALPEYTNVNPGVQKYYAIGKDIFYKLQKNGQLINENNFEGKYCLEVWKYNPVKLAESISKENSVDPLSLYLSLEGTADERIEMTLDQIINKFIW
jgi:hypothetical protein